MGFDEGHGLPTAGDLAQSLAEEVEFPGSDKQNFFQVTQYYAMVRDPHTLRQSIKSKLSTREAQPGEVHRILAGLPFRYVLTTNFDNLIERALQDQGTKNPRLAFYDRRMDPEEIGIGTIDEPIVYKLHGTLDTPYSMVITEDDVIDFASCVMLGKPPLPSAIKTLLSEFSILFIGYGFKDWNIRVMMRALRSGEVRRAGRFDYAIQKRPADEGQAKVWDQSIIYWRQNQSLKCYDMDALSFVNELKSRYHGGEGLP